MIIHLRGLENTVMANTIWREKLKNGWPGFSQEGTDNCGKLDIKEHLEDEDYSEEDVELKGDCSC